MYKQSDLEMWVNISSEITKAKVGHSTLILQGLCQITPMKQKTRSGYCMKNKMIFWMH